MGQIASKGQLHRLACQPLRLAAQQRQGDRVALWRGPRGLPAGLPLVPGANCPPCIRPVLPGSVVISES
jgi:hypothetical protein